MMYLHRTKKVYLASDWIEPQSIINLGSGVSGSGTSGPGLRAAGRGLRTDLAVDSHSDSHSHSHSDVHSEHVARPAGGG